MASLIFAAFAHREATQARQALESAQPTAEQLQAAASAALSRREAELIQKLAPNFRKIYIDMLGEEEAKKYSNPKTIEEVFEPLIGLMDKLGN